MTKYDTAGPKVSIPIYATYVNFLGKKPLWKPAEIIEPENWNMWLILPMKTLNTVDCEFYLKFHSPRQVYKNWFET